MNEQPIAIFDSGLGGLTVVREVQRRLPGDDIVYFGDTARVPYGSKSPETVARYAYEACRFLLNFDPKLIIAACNTASALALDHLRASLRVPVLGVVEPGAAEAVRQSHATGDRPIGVIATEATVNSHAYTRAIGRLSPRTRVVEQACPSLVAVIEEGRDGRDPVVRLLLREYVRKVLDLNAGVLVLGCTHYPLIKDGLADIVGEHVTLVDSAQATAQAAEDVLGRDAALSLRHGGGTLQCYVSDNPQRFREVGSRFLGEPIKNVAWISPEQFLDGQADESPITQRIS